MAKAGQELKRERKRKVERMMFVFEVQNKRGRILLQGVFPSPTENLSFCYLPKRYVPITISPI